jgi:hypothetical protein
MGKAARPSSAKTPAPKARKVKAVKKSREVDAQLDALAWDEVEKRLLQKFGDVGDAADWLNTELWREKIRVFADGAVVSAAGFFEVVPRHARDGRAELRIRPLQALTISLKKLTLERKSFEARLRRTAEPPPGSPPGRKRGAKGKPVWDLLVSEVIWRVHEEGPSALASDRGLADKLVEWLGKQPGVADKDIPDADTIRKKLRVWLSRYPREN